MKLILDTNFLVYSVKYKIFQQLEESNMQLIIPLQVLNEIEKLSKRAKKIKDRDAAKISLQLIKKLVKVETIEAKNADDAALNLALKENAALATLDNGLLKKAAKKGVKTVGIRQKSYINL